MKMYEDLLVLVDLVRTVHFKVDAINDIVQKPKQVPTTNNNVKYTLSII